MRISNRLREFRAREKITQAQLAHRVGVSRQAIVAIEKGEYLPALALAYRLARQFRSTLEELFPIRE